MTVAVYIGPQFVPESGGGLFAIRFLTYRGFTTKDIFRVSLEIIENGQRKVKGWAYSLVFEQNLRLDLADPLVSLMPVAEKRERITCVTPPLPPAVYHMRLWKYDNDDLVLLGEINDGPCFRVMRDARSEIVRGIRSRFPASVYNISFDDK